ncbi:hypothetical protein [Sanguibacter sp. HDW7]|uniref:hypothetical protein n=1 Tax=Sanguibacter sp. HDW7 TaxID=2714931 RepID=UPI00140B6314|nr:hypothetical protein [Sanguibacter sp. HDW7]QIK82450.1 hypothetical protein G7063_01585 [Sanguibacter sp. HDW7]
MGIPILSAVLNAATFVAFEGPDADAAVPWVWALEPIAVSLLALRVPVVWAVSAALGAALLPTASGLLVLGHVPEAVLVLTPWHLANVAFVVIFAGIRVRLRAFGESEEAARRGAEEHARAESEVRRLAALGLLVHDEVLTVLAVAATTGRDGGDAVSDALRVEARHGLGLLGGAPAGRTAVAGSSGQVAASLSASLRRIDPTIVLDVETLDASPPPPDVVDVLARAAAEAVRNSLRHAGEGVTRRVAVRVGGLSVGVVVRDDGCGFTDLEGRDGRLGVREGILARVRAMPGGTAELRSAPGAGTTVLLGWSA